MMFFRRIRSCGRADRGGDGRLGRPRSGSRLCGEGAGQSAKPTRKHPALNSIGVSPQGVEILELICIPGARDHLQAVGRL